MTDKDKDQVTGKVDETELTEETEGNQAGGTWTMTPLSPLCVPRPTLICNFTPKCTIRI